MSDVFVSYKAEDRRRVQPLVQALQAEGYSVWWDEHIGTGDEWRGTIERELDAARCVVVVWSKRSVGPDGHFVRDEASRAQRRHVYVPVLIDSVEPPLGFGESQASSLKGWKGDRSDPRYKAVLAAVARIAGGTPPASVPPAAQRGIDRRTVIAGGAVATVAIAGVGGWALLKPGSASAASESIAVLPFANLSGDPAQAYFSDGIAEELRSALSRAGLQVIGRTSSEAVKNADAKTAARQLGVGNILTGSVRRSPTIVRISAQLIDGTTGVERWSRDYDRPPGDALAIETEIAATVAQALSIALGQAGRAALTVGGTANAAAQDLYLRAREQLRNDDSEASYRHVIGLFSAAITLDPNFAAAWAQRSLALSNLTTNFGTSGAAFDSGFAEAAAHARRAIALAPRLAATHVALAYALQWQLDMTAPLAEYRKAQALRDNDTSDLLRHSSYLTRIGNTDEAITVAKQSQLLDPLNAGSYAAEGNALYSAGRFVDSVALLRRSLEIAPGLSYNRTGLVGALMQLGHYGDASAELAKIPDEYPFKLVQQAILFARRNDRAASEQALDTLQRRWGDSLTWQYVEIFSQQGARERALAALEHAWSIHDPGLTRMKSDRWVDPIRSEPRFAAIQAKVKFPA
jgi:serine/threonine-protein kinase